MQKKYLLAMIGLALGLQAAAGERENRVVKALQLYKLARMSPAELKVQLKRCTRDELSNPDKDDLTPLMRSFWNPFIVKMLLESGADPSIQVNGQDVLTLAFKEAYTGSVSGSKVLDILKNKMGIASEDDAVSHALKQGLVFTQEEKYDFIICHCWLPWEENRDYKMVKPFFFQSKGCLTKGCKKKEQPVE